MSKTTELEEQIAHLTKTVDELSEVVANQEAEMRLLNNRVRMLMEREAERELDADGSVVMTDQPPPHY